MNRPRGLQTRAADEGYRRSRSPSSDEGYRRPAKRHRTNPESSWDNPPEEKKSHGLPVPDGIDMEFIITLLVRSSQWPGRILEETGCNVGLRLGERPCVMLEGDSHVALNNAIARVMNLFDTPQDQQATLMQQFCPEVDLVEEEEDIAQDRSQEVPIPHQIATHLMTAPNKLLLSEASGCTVEWDTRPDEPKVLLTGAEEQIKSALQLLHRATSHCTWGSSEDKVSRILKPKPVESVLVRLAPMSTLAKFEKLLTQTDPVLSIGKEKASNHIFIPDQLISRQHCVIEFDIKRGAVYIMDTSTNGTFLNGQRLPARLQGKVMLSHGDDLLLKDPVTDPSTEFGYMVNITEMSFRKQLDLTAPRRMVFQHTKSQGLRKT